MKACSRCGVSKELSEFGLDKRKADGRAARCRVCLAEIQRIGRQQYPETFRARESAPHRRAKRNARLAKRLRTDSEYRDRLNARQKERYKARKAAKIEIMRERQGNRCHLCRRELGADVEIDHVIPMSAGGTSDPENLALAHRFCNRSRRNLPVGLVRDLFGLAPNSGIAAVL